MLLIPAIDLRGGRCVRLYQGDFAAETRYEHSPRGLLEKYRALGASWVHVVDLDGARDGVLANREVIVGLAAERGLKLQVGGGIRSAEVIEDLISSGIERVVVGSAAVERPDEVIGWMSRFGAERICLALDVRHDPRGEPQVRTRGWQSGTAISLWKALDLYPAAAVRHVLCTDIERDGALAGPSLELYRHAVGRFPRIAWQASGGVRHAADLAALAQTGAAAAVSGKALLEERIRPEELRPFLPDASSPASTSATARS
ncbi:MAG TPA: 1-(5-phosphoribosyl)-5-[(5-phosphoribosylamino)methylideneamino] imidazole-4-carboxamide isomerase [Steroidobacteraceae bacterium]|nr:1-(5-phosphoribosyl)-5-[(5-phosphoribosylamino)methylideneamino] imidazole-4-carboxamide isomerase [Steroidobacteraceae bacterium]